VATTMEVLQVFLVQVCLIGVTTVCFLCIRITSSWMVVRWNTQ